MELAPALTTDPRSTSCPKHIKQGDHYYKDIFTILSNYDFPIDISNAMNGMYIELQYHGHLGIDCIQSIYIPHNVLPLIKDTTMSKMKNLNMDIFSDDGNGNLLKIK